MYIITLILGIIGVLLLQSGKMKMIEPSRWEYYQ